MPPYVVFSDKTLRAIARHRPADPAAFLRCPGVGDRKLEAYGEEFLKTIREFCPDGSLLTGVRLLNRGAAGTCFCCEPVTVFDLPTQCL